MTYRHKQTHSLGMIDWQTDSEVGIVAGGFTWTGSRKAFYEQWEPT